MGHAFTFAVFGDVHGCQVEMYQRVLNYPQPIDLVLQVGDFETHRDEADAASKTGPQKYCSLGQFPQVYASGRVPVPTLFIAGNHEAFRWLDEHEEGIELLPGLSYLGRFGVRHIGPLLVAGPFGIFSPKWFDASRHLAYSNHLPKGWNRATTYFRRSEIEGLVGALESRPDILLVHDWPRGLSVEHPGRRNLPVLRLIEAIRPRWVFCGHHHFYTEGMIPHLDGNVTQVVALGIFDGNTPDMAIAEFSDAAGITLIECCRSHDLGHTG